MTILPRRPVPLLLLALAMLAALAWPAVAPAQGSPASLRLVSTGGQMTLQRFAGSVPLDLGVWVAATGGDFQLEVARPDYDAPAAIDQVDAGSGSVVRDLPDDTLDEWFGLSRFVRVIVRKPNGAGITHGYFTFCPNGWDRQRVDDSGPELSRYPTFCGASSPFTRGMVWGIDSGWATNALGSADFGVPSLRLRAGRYVFVVRIARRYQELLEIPAADAQVMLDVRVKNVRRRGVFKAARAAEQSSRAPVQDVGVPDVTAPDPATLPDLVALPTWSMGTFHRRGRDFLGFAASPWNAGPAPLVVEGFRRPGESVMDAYQYFRDADGNVVGRAQVGEMMFHSHPAHNHWHFLQFAAFTMHDAADLEVVRSRKQAFCLAPTDPIDLTVERASWVPWEGIGTSCGSAGALWVREVLQAGWADTYYQGVPGQAFNITGLPNGWYYVKLELNPLRTLHEVTTANNTESRLVRLSGRPGARRVLVTPWHGIEF
jgi:Lysyl oxidase